MEAALIICIILAYLTQTGNRRWFRHIRLGTLLAIATSAAVEVRQYQGLAGAEEK